MFPTQRSTAISLVLSLGTISRTAPAFSAFVLPTDGGNNLVFALNVPSDSEALYFHLSGPASSSWIAIGTGNEMADSLMFLAYSNQHANNVTFSPRISTGRDEPVFAPSIDIDILTGSGVFNDTYVVNARCENCRRWKSGSLDLKSTAQPWIYAMGPDVTMKSDSKSVSIERHSEYREFTMNMLQATGSAGLPPSTTRTTGASQDGSPTHDHDWASIGHAVLMSLSFIVLMPLGVTFLRVFEKVRWHWLNQSIAAGIAVTASGIGIYLSTSYTKSNAFNSAHQLLGLAVAALLFLQTFLGFWHHRLYKTTQKTTVYAPAHRFLGLILIVAGVVNGGIGLSWSRSSSAVITGYTVAVAVAAIFVIGPVGWKRWRKGGKWGYRRRSASEQNLTLEGPWGDSRGESDVSLARYAQVTTYGDRS